MDCLTAQRLISEAMDRQPLDSALLAEAKSHCRDCAECARFVRGQLVAKQARLPQPPADLADRVMAAIRTEAQLKAEQAAAQAEAAQAAARAAEQADGGDDAATGAPAAQPAEPRATLVAPAKRARRRLPRPVVVGGLAAAILFAAIGAGSVAIFGMRQLSPEKVVTSSIYDPNASTGASKYGTAQDSASGNAAELSAPSAQPQAPAGAAAAGPSDITVNGVVYALSGPSSLDATGRPAVGQTTSSLGGTAPTNRTVYEGESLDTVLAADDKGRVLSFARVTRTYLGQTYVLTAAELNGFGQWPGLPSQVPAPTSADGQPTFVFDGTDAHGVKIYRLATAPVTSGIAIAPNTDANGPVAGDPNWTWWTLQQ